MNKVYLIVIFQTFKKATETHFLNPIFNQNSSSRKSFIESDKTLSFFKWLYFLCSVGNVWIQVSVFCFFVVNFLECNFLFLFSFFFFKKKSKKSGAIN